mmetsp:Transcript_90648/g.265302  ORF Transcript_90648/g.265302 Transcript_90648/m.265302 type:complete len:276 (+) Transcript_90648:650-1477(+)
MIFRKLSTRDAFKVTRSIAPTSAMTAPHIDPYPATVSATMMALLTVAKTMFCLIFETVTRLKRTEIASLRRSESMSTTCALSTATCVPAAPMAMPTSAVASAAASLMPSPTMATAKPWPPRQRRRPGAEEASASLSCCTACTLSSGSSSAFTVRTPSSAATFSAGACRSPVSMMASTPIGSSDATHSAASARAASATPKTAASSPSTPRKQSVWPSASSCAASAAAAPSSQPMRLASLWLPTCTRLPATSASTPSPGRSAKSVTSPQVSATSALA